MSGVFKEELITVREIAELAGRSSVTVRRWVQEGRLTPVFHPSGYNSPSYFDKDEVLRKLPEIFEAMRTNVGGRGKKKDSPVE